MDTRVLENFNPKEYLSKMEDAADLEFLVNNHLIGREDGKVKLVDALSVPNAPLLFPKVIQNIVKEAAEPLLVGTALLQRIDYSYGQTITFPSVGALVAADIPESGEYPERSLQMGGGTVTASIGKSGLAVKITDEMVRYSQFDVIGMHLRAAGRALARWKEQKIFNYIRSVPYPVFDNATPTNSTKGVTTGRDMSGDGNGSLTMDDLFDAYAEVLQNGFIANTLLMHPLMWAAFVKDPTLRAFALANAGGTFFASWTGNVNQQSPWGASSQGGLGISPAQRILSGPMGAKSGALAGGGAPTAASEFLQTQTSAPVLPGYFNVPFRIVVSHFVPFNTRTKLTDIYMFDASELGVLIVDEDITVEEFKDPSRDLTKLKLRERYGIGILNEGKACAVLKNVRAIGNQVVLPATVTLSQSGQINPINPTDNVLD